MELVSSHHTYRTFEAMSGIVCPVSMMWWHKHNLEYWQFLEIWKNDKSCGNQNLENFRLTELGISNKSVENITWNICNSLKSEKNDMSCGNQYLEIFCLTELGISNKKCGKHNLKYVQFLEIWKNDKSGGNFRLTELGISNKKCVKHNLKYLQFLEIWKKWQVLWKPILSFFCLTVFQNGICLLWYEICWLQNYS